MFKDLKHLCFDKDGVLIDVHSYWSHTTEIRANYFKKKLQLTSYQSDILIQNMGIDLSKGKIKKSGPIGFEPREKIIETVKNTLLQFSISLNEREINNCFSQIDNYQQEKGDYKIKLLDGVIEFLEEKANKYVMTIFTSDRKINTELALKSLGIDKYFSEIFGGDSVIKAKPDPEGINKICSRINVNNNCTSYITDTYSDLIMAEKAGLPYKIGLLSGLGLRYELMKKADLVCKDLKELMNYV